MQKLDQFGTINKELSEHRSTSKALQQQVDQLKCLTQVSNGSCLLCYHVHVNSTSFMPCVYAISKTWY